jgi:ribosomal protein L29
MYTKYLRSLSNDALQTKLNELRFELGIEKRKIAATGVSSKKVKIRETRRAIAKILTILQERGAKK